MMQPLVGSQGRYSSQPSCSEEVLREARRTATWLLLMLAILLCGIEWRLNRRKAW